MGGEEVAHPPRKKTRKPRAGIRFPVLVQRLGREHSYEDAKPLPVQRIRSFRASAPITFIVATLVACATGGAPRPTDGVPPSAVPLSVSHGLRIADQYRVAALTTRRFTQEAYWQAIQPSIASRG